MSTRSLSRRRSNKKLAKKIFVYLTSEERKLIQKAAVEERRSVSGFIASSAIRAATELLKNKQRWPALSRAALQALKIVSSEFPVSIAAGDLIYLETGWYITHTGLLRVARKSGCAGVDVRPLSKLCDPVAHRWAFKATVYKSTSCRGFVGYGDADPSNVSPQVRGAIRRNDHCDGC